MVPEPLPVPLPVPLSTLLLRPEAPPSLRCRCLPIAPKGLLPGPMGCAAAADEAPAEKLDGATMPETEATTRWCCGPCVCVISGGGAGGFEELAVTRCCRCGLTCDGAGACG